MGLTRRPNPGLYKYRSVLKFPVTTSHFSLLDHHLQGSGKLNSSERAGHSLVIYIVKLSEI